MSGGRVLDKIESAQNGDKQSMSLLVEENTPLIWSVVRRFFGRGVDPEDLFQLGSIGFIKAVKGFNEEYGTQFSTYAVPKIAGEIKRFLRDDGMIKVSRSIKENAVKVYKAQELFEKKYNTEPRISDIMEMTGLSQEEIAMCQKAQSSAASLDSEMGENGFTLLSSVSGVEEEKALVDKIVLFEAMDKLESVQRSVIDLRYFRDLTQQKTADIIGISQVQVSRIEKKALLEIRKILQDSG